MSCKRCGADLSTLERMGGDGLCWRCTQHDAGIRPRRVRPTPIGRPVKIDWKPTCPYCRKPRIEDGRGLCQECGAEKTDAVRREEQLFWSLCGMLIGYTWMWGAMR